MLNYGAAANWAFARIGAMTGSNAESSLEAFGNADARSPLDRQRGRATPRSAGILDRLANGLNEGGIGIGILNAYAPGAGVQELTAVCQLAAAHECRDLHPRRLHVAHRSRKRRRGLYPPDRLCRRHRRAHAHLPLQLVQQDGHRALRRADRQGAGAGPADHGGGLSLRHRLDRAGGGLLQRSRIRGAQWPRLRSRCSA